MKSFRANPQKSYHEAMKSAKAALLLAAIVSAARLSAPRALRGQDRAELDALTSEAAKKIDESNSESGKRPVVLVAPFKNTHGPASELDEHITREFAESLTRHALSIHVLSPDELARGVTERHLPQEALRSSQVMACEAGNLGASFAIRGDLEDAPDGAVLGIHVVRINRRATIFTKTTVLSLTDEERALAAKPIPDAAPIVTREERRWENPDHPPVGRALTLSEALGEPRLDGPKCRYCPRPDFTEDALAMKMQGTIVVRVQISSEGIPTKIRLVQGLPCGLTDKAFEAVEHWSFEPAKLPDGTPVAVEVPVEVTFRTY